MILSRKSLAITAVAALGLMASACSVLKTPDPIQTYRFGAVPAFDAAAQAQTGACQPIVIALRRIEFVDAARGDRLLSVTGSETAYIGGARWVSQAETLFQSSLENAFADGAPCLRLAPGAFARDSLVLSVDVRRFETVYASAGAVPQVRFSVNASLIQPGDRSVVAERRFEVTEGADANRVSAIVAAYEAVNAEAVRQVVQWTATTAPQVYQPRQN